MTARIALDAMGGDNAPHQTVLGALDAAAKGIDVVLVGDQAALEAELAADPQLRQMAEDYRAKREAFLPVLHEVGFKCNPPGGAYYVMADGSGFGFADDVALSLELVKNAGVAVVPGSSFFSNPADGKDLVRSCFCKKSATLQEAAQRLSSWAQSR